MASENRVFCRGGVEVRIFKAKGMSRKKKTTVVFRKWIPLQCEQMRKLWFEDGVRPCCWVRHHLPADGLASVKVVGNPPRC